MPQTAIALYVIFAVLGFGWRSWIQYRRTGSTGFRGMHGRVGSLEWFASIGFVAAIMAGLAAPILQLVGLVSPLAVLHASWIQVAGTITAVGGIAVTVYAQRDLGESWRIGVDPSEETTLVRDGVFALMRNPIFTAMLIFAGGITLMTPNLLAMAAFILLLVAIELQVRVVEEPYLLNVHREAYRDYREAVGRFLPG